jgi:hypothetical protein
MSTFVTPVDPAAALTRVTPSAPVPDLRFQGDPLMWIGVPASTAIAAFATGAIARSQGASGGLPGNSTSAWTLFQLSPLPQMNSSAFKLIAGGLPVQLVLVPGTAGPTPANDDRLVAGAAWSPPRPAARSSRSRSRTGCAGIRSPPSRRSP